MENYLMIAGVKIELTAEQLDLLGLKKKIEWSDFGKIEGFYISAFSEINNFKHNNTNSSNRNTFPRIEEAEACLALSQLCQWRNKYNKGWIPDWKDDSIKFCISLHKDKINTVNTDSHQHVLSFKSVDIKNKFIEDFSELIMLAKSLL